MAETNEAKHEAVHSSYFYIPDVSLFLEGNPYILSENTFNCKIEPCDEGLKAIVWYGMKCFELSDHESEHTSEKSEAGLGELIGFIDGEYEKYKRKVDDGEVSGRRTYKPAQE